jgi:RimJ/RimL family protein N-acetyltransferase
MTHTERTIAFAPIEQSHLPLLETWLSAPHVREWWGDPDVELGHIRDMIEGRDTTRPFIFFVDGQPVGYIQYWFIGHHQNETWIVDNPWLAELPPDAIGVDLSIGEPALLSQGIGSMALRAFVDNLVADGHDTIIIDPDPNNARAIKAYRKAGFRPIPDLVGKTGDCIIMQYEPKATDLS